MNRKPWMMPYALVVGAAMLASSCSQDPQGPVGPRDSAGPQGEVALPEAKGKIAPAKEVGLILADKAKKKGIIQVVFDRNGFLYHGRVAALAEGAREGGLEL